MERIFPLLGVRFISVNDGYDSGMQAWNDVRGLEVAIKNIINASYSRDLSAKIAAADHVMQKKGMYLGGYRPFGFLSDPNDCHKLILDPVASRYVRLIFELALQGNRQRRRYRRNHCQRHLLGSRWSKRLFQERRQGENEGKEEEVHHRCPWQRFGTSEG